MAAETLLHVVIMGVSGSGKTTLAQRLGEELAVPVLEADDLHPDDSLAALNAGDMPSALQAERWLGAVREWISQQAAEGRDTVVACPALTRAHRDILRAVDGLVFFVHLYGTEDVLAKRSANRDGDPVPPQLVRKQLNVLQRLWPEEKGVQLDVMQKPEQLLQDALAAIAFARRAYVDGT